MSRRYQPYTHDERERVASLRREGRTWPEIAAATGRGVSALWNWANAGYPVSGRAHETRPMSSDGAEADARADAARGSAMLRDAIDRLLARRTGDAVPYSNAPTGLVERVPLRREATHVYSGSSLS